MLPFRCLTFCARGRALRASWSRRLETSRHVAMQHLGVLREADLVLVEPRGRKRVNHLNPLPIQQFHQRWVSRYEENWAAALVVLTDGKQVFVVGRVVEVDPPRLTRSTEGTRVTLRDSVWPEGVKRLDKVDTTWKDILVAFEQVVEAGDVGVCLRFQYAMMRAFMWAMPSSTKVETVPEPPGIDRAV